MIWRDIVINLSPPRAILISTLAEVFGVEQGQVNIIASVAKIARDRSVNCVISNLPGEFSVLLSFYLDFEVRDDLVIISQLCAAFFCEALISNDENLDPYSMVLVDQAMEPRIVNLDPERLDEAEEYVIL